MVSGAQEGSKDPTGASWRENHITGLSEVLSSAILEPSTTNVSAMLLDDLGTCSNWMSSKFFLKRNTSIVDYEMRLPNFKLSFGLLDDQ